MYVKISRHCAAWSCVNPCVPCCVLCMASIAPSNVCTTADKQARVACVAGSCFVSCCILQCTGAPSCRKRVGPMAPILASGPQWRVRVVHLHHCHCVPSHTDTAWHSCCGPPVVAALSAVMLLLPLLIVRTACRTRVRSMAHGVASLPRWRNFCCSLTPLSSCILPKAYGLA
jgi:uncharacterized membrane protein YhdT